MTLEINGEILTIGVKLVQFNRVGLVGVHAECVLEGLGPDLVGMDIDAEMSLSAVQVLGMSVLEMDLSEDASEVGESLGP